MLDRKSPYELLFGKLLKLEYIKIFGCLYFNSVLPKGNKFESRAKKVVLLDFFTTQKGYKLYDLGNRNVFISRDVTFIEEVFPFKVMYSYKGPFLYSHLFR